MQDRIPTRVNLNDLKLDIESIICPIGGSTRETTEHILFEYPVAVKVWRFIERWCSLPLSSNKSMDSMIRSFNRAHENIKAKGLLEAVFFCSCYILWSFRSMCAFDNPPLRKNSILDQVVENLFIWVLSNCIRSARNPIFFICNLLECIANL